MTKWEFSMQYVGKSELGRSSSRNMLPIRALSEGSACRIFEMPWNGGEVIEDYPHDKYGPSCLVLGFTLSQRPLHIHCSYPMRPIIKIITLYEPDPLKMDRLQGKERGRCLKTEHGTKR